MQRSILQALNPLSNRVTFTAIVAGAYSGEATICLTGYGGHQPTDGSSEGYF